MIRLATVVLAATACFVGAVSAAETDASVVQAQAIVDAIRKGENLSPFLTEMNVRDTELAEFSSLAGCRPKVGEGSSKSHFLLIYACDSVKNQQAPRGYLLELILVKGELSEIWLNPEGPFASTGASSASEALPNRTTIGKNFAQAIRNGEEPTLGGLIALTPGQLRRLSQYQGCSPSILQPANRKKSMYRWQCKKMTSAHETITELHFDDQGRPVGLSFGKIFTRVVNIYG